MRLRQVWNVIAIFASASILSGCADAIRPVPFAGTLLLSVGLLVLVSSALQSTISSRSWTAAISAVISAVLALLSLDVLGQQKLIKRDFAIMNAELALFLFALSVLLGGGFATVFVLFDPKFSIYAFVLSSILLLAVVAVWLIPVENESVSRAAFVVGGVAFAAWSGSLFAAGLFYERKITPLLVTALAVGGVCFLAYRGWSTSEWRAKFGIYVVMFILSYETWLLVRGVIVTWN